MIRNTQTQFIGNKNNPEYAVVPYAVYALLLEKAEMLDDVAAYDAAKRDTDDELIDGSVVEALVNGDNPVAVWRKQRNMSQSELASAIGKTQPYIAQIEKGKRDGSIAVYKAMAAVLHVDLDDLAPA